MQDRRHQRSTTSTSACSTASCPVEYGPVTAVMHQNMFAYLAAMVDSNGRFIFGDGLMTYSPNDVRENIRISNCLPDPTDGLTLGIDGCAVRHRRLPRRDRRLEGRPTTPSTSARSGSSSGKASRPRGASTTSFGAEDGGFVACCPAASILTVGP